MVLLTSVLRTLVKDSKIKTIDNFYINKVAFLMLQYVKYTNSKIKFLISTSNQVSLLTFPIR